MGPSTFSEVAEAMMPIRLSSAAGVVGVADEIGFVPPRREDGTEIWSCAIARDPSLDTEFPETSMIEALSRNMDTLHFEWQMRPQVVQALRALGW